ncbi:amidohydrolase 2 [Syntrophobotulus glycolicus DSM 8271]|uniref:Amidohydrolase 2 n=1 Tax=Syntrophobotulus glycolicus (strain DSM 8271 / FlGlyR) TaxID=645991 RepID=F0SUG0_SYNGF|nr:amidohydrolase family protein [Syntrophobotulus glycolicus]ADY56610.1 amidohydrolase 2 [Syntrophobotulus glycolicus DSM 8271]
MPNRNSDQIIDFHNHIFPENIAERAVASIGCFYDSVMEGKGTVEDMLRSGAGIGHFVISSTATTKEQVTAINNFIAQKSALDDRLIGFGSIHPAFANPAQEIDRIIALGLRGIKLHSDFQEYNIDDRAMYPIYEALEGRLPVIFHIGDYRMDYSNPLRLLKVLDRFPKLTVIAAHLGGYTVWDELGDVLIGKDLFIDTSSALMFLPPQRAVDLIRRHGVEKVLYGTDYPMWSHQTELERIHSLGLTQEEVRKILSGNASQLFGLSAE